VELEDIGKLRSKGLALNADVYANAMVQVRIV